jgi:hypothetical protein
MVLLAGMAGALCTVPLGIRVIKNIRSTPVSEKETAQEAAKPPHEVGGLPASLSETDRHGLEEREKRTVCPPVVARSNTNAHDRAKKGIERIEAIVSDKGLSARNAAVFRAQMAPRLVAAGADRQVVESWLRQTVPPPVAPPPAAADVTAVPETSTPDFSTLTPEEREVIGMNANFIHATSQPHRN